jgi:hypothetical protein
MSLPAVKASSLPGQWRDARGEEVHAEDEEQHHHHGVVVYGERRDVRTTSRPDSSVIWWKVAISL